MIDRHTHPLLTILAIGLSATLVAGSVSATGTWESGEIVLWLEQGASIDDVNQRWGTETVDSFATAGLYLVFIDGVDELENFAEMMTGDPDVANAEPNYIEDTPEGVRQMIAIIVGGGYVDYEDQLLTDRIALDAAHAISTGAGVTIAVLDTGVDPTHEALVGHLVSGWDFVDADAEPWEVFNDLDDDGDGEVDDGYGHGTMVAGILALVAPDASILPVRILDDEGRADAFRVIEGIRYAIESGADILNMSFGVPIEVDAIEREIQYGDMRGALMVAAAGNASTEIPPYYPGSDGDTIMVTALDSVDVKADFADWHEEVDVSAPGTGVRSSYPGGQWALGAGCSFATPFVSGIAALVQSLHPTWTASLVQSAVVDGADAIYHLPGNGAYVDKLGSGRVNALGALNQVVGIAPVTGSHPVPSAWPNPTRGAIRLDVPGSGRRLVSIYDVAGRLVFRQRVDRFPFVWTGVTTHGAPTTPGVYYVDVTGAASALRIQILR